VAADAGAITRVYVRPPPGAEVGLTESERAVPEGLPPPVLR